MGVEPTTFALPRGERFDRNMFGLYLCDNEGRQALLVYNVHRLDGTPSRGEDSGDGM
jgi:hypothetical protein